MAIKDLMLQNLKFQAPINLQTYTIQLWLWY